MQGIVQIGKTNRDPLDRVDELSSATGVPTPFILVYQLAFNDVSRAEILIHQILESKGRRISQNREFFRSPTHEVIDLIQSLSLDTDIDEDQFQEQQAGQKSDELRDLAFNIQGVKIQYINCCLITKSLKK